MPFSTIQHNRLRSVAAALSAFSLLALAPAALAAPFSAATSLDVSGSPGGVALADLNGDGKLDLIATNSGDDRVAVRFGTGNGAFGAIATYNTDIQPYAVAIGDMNKDGKPDIITSNRTGNTISYLQNRGDGTFAANVDEAVGRDPIAVEVADLDLDGNLDVVAVNITDGTISVILGNGNGTFNAASTYAAGTYPDALTIGNFDADAYPDIAVGNSCAGCFVPYNSGTVSVFINRRDGTYNPRVNYAATKGVTGIGSADMDGDGNLDLVVSRRNLGDLGVYLGAGDGTFGAITGGFGSISQPFALTLGDFNGDGFKDAMVTNGAATNVTYLPGLGDGTFDTGVDYAVPTTVLFIAQGDLNADGKKDFVAAGTATDVYEIFDAAPPVITELSPTRSIKDHGVTLDVRGTGFTSDSVIKVGTTSLVTTFRSSTELTALLDGPHASTLGSYPVTVYVPLTDASTSSTTFTVAEQTSTGTGVPIPTGYFDMPFGPFGVTINDGANATDSRFVKLKMTAGSNVARMAISASPDFHSASQIPFAPEKTWDVCAIAEGTSAGSCPEGVYTIYVKFFTTFGHASPVVSQKITYGTSGTSVTNSKVSTSVSRVSFSRLLKLGMTHEDVRALQKYLNANGFTVATAGAGSPGKETSFFGRGTSLALIRFQNAHASDILKPAGLSTGTGLFGELTRTYVNAH